MPSALAIEIDEKLSLVPKLQKQVDDMEMKIAKMDRIISVLSTEERRLVSQNKATVILGYSKQSLKKMREQGILHPKKIGGQWKYRVDELEHLKSLGLKKYARITSLTGKGQL